VPKNSTLKIDLDAPTMYEDRAITSLQELKNVIDFLVRSRRPSLASNNFSTGGATNVEVSSSPGGLPSVIALLDFIKECLTDLQLIQVHKKN
jgi:hypothetical protein